jgi:hypothetical protein
MLILFPYVRRMPAAFQEGFQECPCFDVSWEVGLAVAESAGEIYDDDA